MNSAFVLALLAPQKQFSLNCGASKIGFPSLLLSIIAPVACAAIFTTCSFGACTPGTDGGVAALQLRLPFQGQARVVSQGYCGFSHTGFEVDFQMDEGTVIVAAAGGTVVDVNGVDDYQAGMDCRCDTDNCCLLTPRQQAGRFVKLGHQGGFTSSYLHLSTRLVQIGDPVLAGQVIGYSGNTGWSTGAHLHFHVRNAAITGISPTPMLGTQVEGGVSPIATFVEGNHYLPSNLGRPAVVTGTASQIAATTASIAGTVNPNASAARVYFEYGTSSTLSSPSTTPQQDVGSGSVNVNVSANLSGLTSSTRYYFRLVGVNAIGTTVGSISDFTTASATLPTLVLDRTTIDFGTVPTNNSNDQVFLMSNPAASQGSLSGTVGDLSAPYSVVNGGGAFSLLPGQSKFVSVRFQPTSDRTSSQSLQITHNGQNSPASVFLTGVGLLLTVGIEVSPSPLAFNNITVGGGPAQWLSIMNPSSATGILVGDVVTPTAPFYVCCNQHFAIAPGGTFSIQVRFLPTTAGAFSQPLTITHNAPDSPKTVPLAGETRTALLLVSPTVIDYGRIEVGRHVDQSVVILNDLVTTGNVNGDNLISEDGVPGGEAGSFSLVSGNVMFNLAPGQANPLVIRFAPRSVGTFTGAVVVHHNAGDSPTTVPITGVGIPIQPPFIKEAARGASYFAIGVETVNGKTNTLEVNDGLSGGAWVAASSTTNGGMNVLSDTNANSQVRIYRVRVDQ